MLKSLTTKTLTPIILILVSLMLISCVRTNPAKLSGNSKKNIELCEIPNSHPNFIDRYELIDNSKMLPLFKYNGSEYGDELVYLASKQLNKTVQQVFIPKDFKVKKHQFRSTWIATINNLTMPKSETPQDFKNKYEEYLNTHENFNMNAVIFQVRPLLDAYYSSEINPVSEFLSSGKQGVNNWDFKDFDPLKYMIEVAHQRGLEFHAWFNPYRVTHKKLTDLFQNTQYEKIEKTNDNVPEIIAALNSLGVLSDHNFAVLNPAEVYLFDEKLFLNPSREKVVEHVVQTISEVLKNYNVDAIHFDDYFYPYRVTVDNKPVYFETEDREDFIKAISQLEYPDTKEGLQKWRRENVNKLIQSVKSTIDTHNKRNKTSVQFGISPFGIWEHKVNNPFGSNTPIDSTQSYSKSIYADSKLWVDEGLIDYIVPQIYWSFEESAAPYGELAVWWNNIIEKAHLADVSKTKTQLYIGHANYKNYHNSWEIDWANPEEIINQLKFNQTLAYVDGSVYFSYNELIKEEEISLDEPKPHRVKVRNKSIELLNQYNDTPVLVPPKPWLDHQITNPPINVFFTDELNAKTLDSISWEDTPQNDSQYYVIYRGFGKPAEIFKNPRNIIKKIWRNGENKFLVTFDNEQDEQFTYLISALDAAQNESEFVVVKASKELALSKNYICK